MAGLFFDLGDISHTIVLTHFSPIVQPKLFVCLGVLVVLLTVLGSSVVAEPNVKAGVMHLKGQGHSVNVHPEPRSGICAETVLD